VTLEQRRGDDYTIVDTRADHMAYDPHKLSMEKVETAFGPEDRMGALELQNLSILDNRALLIHHLSSLRRLGPGEDRALEATPDQLAEVLALEDPDRTES
jgi:argininosuccinate synthase